MADLADITAAGRSDVIPGHILSPLTLRDYGSCELEWEAQARADALVMAGGMPDADRRSFIEQTVARIAGGRYAFGSQGFDDAALKTQNLPFLLYLSLRRKHPDMTREKAAEFLDGDNAPDIQSAVLSLAGYEVKKKETSSSPAEPSTGTPSPKRSSKRSPATPPSPT